MFNDANQLIAFTYSNELGEFGFENVEAGDYYMLLDVPYIPQIDIQNISLAEGGSYFGANFEILPDGIYSLNGAYLDANIEDVNSTLIYPNPVNDKLNIVNFETGGMDYQLSALNGQVVLFGITNLGLTQLDVNSLENGVYLLYVSDYQVVKIVVAK